MTEVEKMAHASKAQKKLKEMMRTLTVALETIGMVNPVNKVYYLTKPLEKMSLVMALFTISMLKEMRFD
jgi:hypothetical protein